MLDQMVDDRVATKVQMLDALLKIFIGPVRKQRPIPPFGLRRYFVLGSAWHLVNRLRGRSDGAYLDILFQRLKLAVKASFPGTLCNPLF